ncbi:MAG TPA: hypothetical protein VFL70_05620 [Bacteroidia bacterium]|nr:hypothetical protein [Bacteroidia bacterium]
MKTKFFLFSLIVLVVFWSCNTNERYLDLNTRQYVDLKKDSLSGYMVNSKTGEPVDVYVDTKNHDTLYGMTGEVVNGRIHKTEEGKWIVKTDGDEYKAKSESENSAKIKAEGDEYKAKNGSYTIKKEGDGDVKIENGNTQVKVDGETGERKVKKDKNLTDKVKKIFD